MLSLLSCGVFLQVNCFVKMTAMIIAFIVYNLVMHCWYSPVFHAFDEFLYPTKYDGIPLLQSIAIRGSLHVAMLLFTLHLLDRQIEHTSRLDFIWKEKFK